ncbi:hypothetical protein EV13_0880 [Prochlorococcus sp. MIT 0702]|nr:hypothetical protein EV12_0499 [Prochlorococcus sp. MIT 0701]KGG29663.1 hypothetical protein EV13_0880 [Prochlorococcus sp. MIT 0702]KGG34217.1 hypothetical protein EV14_1311 [Prochlorococcus sp. MIT 0703]
MTEPLTRRVGRKAVAACFYLPARGRVMQVALIKLFYLLGF